MMTDKKTFLFMTTLYSVFVRSIHNYKMKDALLNGKRRPSAMQKGVFYLAICKLLIICMLQNGKQCVLSCFPFSLLSLSVKKTTTLL